MKRRHLSSLGLVLALVASRPARGQEVQRVDVHERGLVGRFYAAAGASHRTGVMLLTGSGGGIPEDVQARDLARAGYAVLAIAYFRDREGNPPELAQKELRNVPLEYLFQALDWMKARPEVRADRIALMGESRGAELALLVASLRPDVAGVIAFSPQELRWAAVGGGGAAWTLNGAPLPYAEGVYNRDTPMSQFTDILDGAADVRGAAAIEVEHIHAPVLLISSRADAMSPSARMANDIEARLRAHGFSYRVENVQYENASHLLMGFGPGLTEIRVRNVFTMHFGGTAEGTEAARNAGWARAKEFLGRL
ncbi:MAG: dienelactone hydrolase family protein [Gemmatimonadetes bacterium]|nr:dienelactone hydrolase family protein [Gemmatimonadota bacterium]